MVESQLEQLQAEIEELRRKSKKRSFKQVMKDGWAKVKNSWASAPCINGPEEAIIFIFILICLSLLIVATLILFAYTLVKTNGLALLLLPIYPLYLIFRKER